MYVKMLLAVWSCLTICALLTYGVVWFNLELPADKEQAFQECLEEVKNNCSSVIAYAVMLENENARLNKVLKETKNSCRTAK